MKVLDRSSVAFWTLILGISAGLYGAMQLLGFAVAHAAPAVAGDWRSSQAAAIGDSAVTWLLGALVILKVVEMALARIAPLTPTKMDDKALAVVHGLRETAEEILTHVKPTETKGGGS